MMWIVEKERDMGISYEIKRQTLNEKTKAALDEYEDMRRNPDQYKRYESFDELLNEVFVDAEDSL